MTQPTCETCKFWVFLSQDGVNEGRTPLRFGECRRYPPQRATLRPFAITRMIDWCGEHRPIPLAPQIVPGVSEHPTTNEA